MASRRCAHAIAYLPFIFLLYGMHIFISSSEITSLSFRAIVRNKYLVDGHRVKNSHYLLISHYLIKRLIKISSRSHMRDISRQHRACRFGIIEDMAVLKAHRRQ